MYQVKMQDGSIKYENSKKHRPGSWYEGQTGWYIIETAEAGEVMGEYGIEKTWLHTMREATVEELAQKAEHKTERDAKTSDERVGDSITSLANEFPGLDW